MKYFTNIHTLDELKKAYRRLAMVHHPDVGGDPEVMKAINNEHDALFEVLKKQHNAKADEYHQTTETPEEFREVIEKLLTMDGLDVELCGSWLWKGIIESYGLSVVQQKETVVLAPQGRRQPLASRE